MPFPSAAEDVYDASAINEFGSGRGWYIVSTATGPSTGAYTTMPLFKDSTLSKKATTTKKEDEGGLSFQAGTKYEGQFTGTFMQRSELVFQFIDFCNDNYVAIVKELNRQTLAGDYLYAFIPIAQGDGGKEIKAPGGEVAFTYDLTAAPDSINYALGSCTGFTGSKVTITGTVTVPVDEYFGIIAISA